MKDTIYSDGGNLGACPTDEEIKQLFLQVDIAKNNLRRVIDLKKKYRMNERTTGKFSVDVDRKIKNFLGNQIIIVISDLKSAVSPTGLTNHGGKTWTTKFARIYNVFLTKYNGKQVGIRRDMLQ